MKKINLGNEVLFLGEAEEIKATYKAIVRGFNNYKTEVYPLFCKFPQFADNKIYGLTINSDNQMVVINSDTALSMLLKEERVA